jgi:hypothetical protein
MKPKLPSDDLQDSGTSAQIAHYGFPCTCDCGTIGGETTFTHVSISDVSARSALKLSILQAKTSGHDQHFPLRLFSKDSEDAGS